ncbi:MAG: thermonuclease family protein [Pseudomonadota bacterium]
MAGPFDAPELRGSPRCNGCDHSAGIRARDRLRQLLARPAVLHCRGVDRYQRRLCRVTIDGRDVGDQMVREGHGVIVQRWR